MEHSSMRKLKEDDESIDWKGFSTVIFPDKDKILISRLYVKHFMNVLKDVKTAKVLHPKGWWVKADVDIYSDPPFMTGGERFMKVSGISYPIHVCFVFEKDFIFEKEEHSFKIVNLRRYGSQNSPILLEDKEEEQKNSSVAAKKDTGKKPLFTKIKLEPVSNLQPICKNVKITSQKTTELKSCSSWEKVVTSSMALKKKAQVLHFPHAISEHVLGKKQKTILLKSVGGRRNYSCQILTADRMKNEKYLGKGWYEFLSDNDLKVGDKLVFNLEDGAGTLVVKVEDGANRA